MDFLSRTQSLLSDLIAFQTVSSDSNLEMISFMAQLLEDSGASAEIIAAPCGTKANLFATIGPKENGGILLSGHSDVVPVADQNWSTDPFVMTQQGGRLYGRGTCDMKGFLAATIAMAPTFAAKVTTRPMHFAFTYDEETGCLGAQHLAKVLQARELTPKVAIIGEPTNMQIIEGHKGCYEYSTHFHGLEGHGSTPEQGVNAVEVAVEYVAHLIRLKHDLQGMAPEGSPFHPPWSTVNVGAIHGGIAHNVIAPKARVDWEMRPVQSSDADYVKGALHIKCTQELLPKMRAVFPSASIELETIGEVAGLLPMQPNEARQMVSELTGSSETDVVSFGTEAGIFQELGTDVVVCGPGSIDQAHKADEFVTLDQLSQCLKMLDRLGDKLHNA